MSEAELLDQGEVLARSMDPVQVRSNVLLSLIAAARELKTARAEAERSRSEALGDALIALQNVKELYSTLEAGAKKDSDWNEMDKWGRCRKAVNAGMETVRALATPEPTAPQEVEP